MATNRILKVKEACPGVLHVETETQYDLTSTFMRVQEFYESPYGEIRGRFFTHERYMDICAYGTKRSTQDEVIFSYLEDWNGFNVPGNVFDKWSNLFAEHYLWDKEELLIKKVNNKKPKGKYYVIGTHREGEVGDYDHELSHAWYYLDPKYKKMMHKLLDKLSTKAREQIKKNILDDGYLEDVIDDESIAYLSTNSMVLNKKMFGKIRVPWTLVYEFQKAFAEYKEKQFDEDH